MSLLIFIKTSFTLSSLLCSYHLILTIIKCYWFSFRLVTCITDLDFQTAYCYFLTHMDKVNQKWIEALLQPSNNERK